MNKIINPKTENPSEYTALGECVQSYVDGTAVIHKQDQDGLIGNPYSDNEPQYQWRGDFTYSVDPIL